VHDLRNLVAPIRNAALILKLRYGEDHDLRSLAELINRQVDAMCRLLDGAAPGAASVAVNSNSVAKDAPHESRGISQEKHQPKRALIADDNVALRLSLSAILQDMGFEVKQAATGYEALAVAQEWFPSFVFIDVNMPSMNGFEVATALRSRFPATSMKLFLMTGESLTQSLIKNAERVGFNQCLDKVNDLAALHHILR
jgi:CheY-like chemotaxis protein